MDIIQSLIMAAVLVAVVIGIASTFIRPPAPDNEDLT